MNDKASMLEAVKRKRFQLKSGEEDMEHDKDQELAPERDNMENSAHDVRSPMHQNQTALGKEGFAKEEHVGGPLNSKNMFHDPKKDTHDEVDLNSDRNMAGSGGGLETKYDKMGVDEHKDVRAQSSHLAKANMHKAGALKSASRHAVQGSMDIHDKDASSDREAGDDVTDALGDEPEGKGSSDIAFDSGRGGAMKAARGKLEGFLSKRKV